MRNIRTIFASGIVALLCLGLTPSMSAQTLKARLLWSDEKASATATFQSHVSKIFSDGNLVYLAYTYHRADGGLSNKLAAINLIDGAVKIETNFTNSNSGCLISIRETPLHIYEDFKQKKLIVDTVGGQNLVVIPKINTAGKITRKKSSDHSAYVATTYGAVIRLDFGKSLTPTPTLVHKDFQIKIPEHAQYPYLALLNEGFLVFNNTIDNGWYYLDLIMSFCTATQCSKYERIFPEDVRLANSWVGDIFAKSKDSIVVYYSKNNYQFNPHAFRKNLDSNIGYVGFYQNGEWTTHELGPRLLSGKLILHDGQLLVVSMTHKGKLTIHAVTHSGLVLKAQAKIDINCAYAMDAIWLGLDLIIAVTDRGKGCFNKNKVGTAQIWRIEKISGVSNP